MKTKKYTDVFAQARENPNYEQYLREAEERLRTTIARYNKRKAKKA